MNAVLWCEWATCDDVEAEPGSLFCRAHGRVARREGTPWRRPGVPIRRRVIAPPVEVETASTVTPPDVEPLPLIPPPMEPALSPPATECRVEGCTEPPLEKTLNSRSNRWRNLCDAHYAEKRLDALGPARRAQLAVVSPADRNDAVPDRAERSYAERARGLVEAGRDIDEARAAYSDAWERWRRLLADLLA